MKLFNKTYIIALALVATTVSSCSDWLDYQPADKTTAEQQFSTRAGYYSTVNGVYNNLTTTTLYGSNLTHGAIDLMARRYEPGTSSATSVKYNWSNSRYTYLDTQIGNIWKAAYKDILNINVILHNMEKQNGSVLNAIDSKLIKGDLLALRAFLHFDMLRLFGNTYWRDSETPVVPYNNSAEAQAYELRSAKSIVYDCLIPDLDEAEKNLQEVDPVTTECPLASDNDNGDNYRRYRQLRINCYAVALLKARIYLWAEDYDNALLEAKKITDNPRSRNFSHLSILTVSSVTMPILTEYSPLRCSSDSMIPIATMCSQAILTVRTSLPLPFISQELDISKNCSPIRQTTVISHGGSVMAAITTSSSIKA